MATVNNQRKCLCLLWLCLIWLDANASIMCPSKCSCYLDHKGRNTVSCNYEGITGPILVDNMAPDTEVIKISAPEDNMNMLTMGKVFHIFPKVEEIHITRSNIPELGMHLFWGLKKLTVLNMSQNNITQPLDYNFRGLFNLKDLNLDDNRISSLPSGTFRYLPELRILSLQRNRIEQMMPRIFQELGKLKILKLSGNNLGEFNVEAFKDVPHLQQLECRACGLKKINTEIYYFLPYLTNLDLGNNNFKHVSADDFKNLEDLLILKLDGNKFTFIPVNTFMAVPNLKSLNLARNRINYINAKAFSGLHNLTELNLSFNKLEHLESTVFEPVSNTLELLDISGNPISVSVLTVAFRGVPELKELHLADAGLSYIPDNLLPEKLIRLNLAGNYLAHLNPGALPIALNALDVSRNRFRGFDEDILQRVEYIPTLELKHNPWSCDLCHIIPMLERANRSIVLRSVKCSYPFSCKDRMLGTLRREDLDWCTAPGYTSGDANFFLTGNDGRIGIIAAGASVLLLFITCLAVMAALCYSRRHAAKYYTHEEKRNGEGEAIFENQSGIFGDERELSFKFPMDINDKKIAIATIDDELKKEHTITNGY